MDTIQKLKNLIESHDLNKASIASELGWSRERFHYFLNYGKSCDVDLYAQIRRAIENRGVRVDDLDTMSITGMTAHLNTQAGKLVEECIHALSDGCLSDQERLLLKTAVKNIKHELELLSEKL